MADFPEFDWQTLRALKPVLLDRLCTRIMDECRAEIDSAEGTAHERYLRLFDLIDRRNDELADAFDDMRRSRAIERLAHMRRLGLFTEEEFQRLSPGTRKTVEFLTGISG